MNPTDILNKYITVVEATYDPAEYFGFNYKLAGYLIIEFNHPRFFYKGTKEVNVFIYEYTTASEIKLLVTAEYNPFDDYPFKPFMKYCGISDKNINSWVVEKYIETLRNQRIDVSSISYYV